MATATELHQPSTDQRRSALAVWAAFNALAAWGGAAALGTGVIDLGGRLNARLPFDSPVFGACALAIIVALPLTSLAWHAWHGDFKTQPIAIVTGVLLIGWIIVEVAFIRELSFFHPLYLAIGAGFIVSGSR